MHTFVFCAYLLTLSFTSAVNYDWYNSDTSDLWLRDKVADYEERRHIYSYDMINNNCGRSGNQKNHEKTYNVDYNNAFKRIVGGSESIKHEWPWLASLMIHGNVHMCGGTLIDPRPFWSDSLSDDPRNWTARLGEHNMLRDDKRHIDIGIEEIYIPSERDIPRKLNIDISLLKLKHPVPMNSQSVNFVCLPGSIQILRKNKRCVTAGWGHTIEDGKISPVVRHVSIPLINKIECSHMYENITVLHPENDDVICAMGKGKDACQYDSGGPFICYNYFTHRWELTGIVSTGMGCARENFPGLYTKVMYFTDWIKRIMRENEHR